MAIKKDILSEMMAHFNKSRFIGHINMATGTGKTYMQIYLALAALLTGTRRPVLVISPQQQLVQQFFEDAMKIVQSIPGLPISPSQIIKVDSAPASVSVDALSKNPSLNGRPRLLIICAASYLKIQECSDPGVFEYQSPCMLLSDESHTLGASITKLHQQLPSLRNCVIAGFSATPKPHALWALPGSASFEYSRATAVAHDYLAPCIVDRFNYSYSSSNVR